MSFETEPLAWPLEVSKKIGIPVGTLANWRSQHKGPEYIKIGRHVRYRWSAVDAYLDAMSKETED